MSDVAKKYKKLDHIDHILLRPARYLGSASLGEYPTWIFDNPMRFVEKAEFTPAFLKCFDEIIQNSFDHSRTPEGSHVTHFDVRVNKMMNTISVRDNGGIPVVKHPEHKVYIPEMIFGELFSGSNFNDDDEDLANKAGGGQNGEGSSLVNVFSEWFKVETADGKNKCEVMWRNNMRDKGEVKVTKSKERFTEVTYKLDFARINMSGIDQLAMDLLRRRTAEIAMCSFPIRVSFNGEDLTMDFKTFVSRFGKPSHLDIQNRWRVAVMKSDDGFIQNSYVNATNTHKGGPHIDHVMDAIVKELRDAVKKKTKQDVRPADIKSHFHLVLDCQIDLPRYNSQTKEELDTRPSLFGSKYTPSKKFIQQIVKGPIMESIIEWALRKQQADEDKEAAKLEKDAANTRLHDIVKYETAIEKDRSKCMLLITEGDSAAKPLQSARQKWHGIYPLKGKPLNVHEVSKAQLLKNDEFSDLVRIMGLSTTNSSLDRIRYGRGVCICTDADLDGIHIRGLVFNIFGKYWPKAFECGLIHVLNTPIAIVERKKGDDLEFFDQVELEKWVAKQPNKNYHVRYLKGLGSNNSSDFKRYLSDEKYMVTMAPLSQDDIDALDLAFNKDRSDDRKLWLGE